MNDFIFTGDDARDFFIACCITMTFVLGIGSVLAYDSANLTRRPVVVVHPPNGYYTDKEIGIDGKVHIRIYRIKHEPPQEPQ